jgi:hypothetical protein
LADDLIILSMDLAQHWEILGRWGQFTARGWFGVIPAEDCFP